MPICQLLHRPPPFSYSCDIKLHASFPSSTTSVPSCCYLRTLEAEVKSTYFLKSKITSFDKWGTENLVRWSFKYSRR